MGQSSSSEQKHATFDASDNMKEVSTGTHFVEIHAPTAGFGVGSLLLLAGIVYLAFRCRRAMKKSSAKKEAARDMRTARMLAMMGGYDNSLSWVEQGPRFTPVGPKFDSWPTRPSRIFPSSSRFEELGDSPAPPHRAHARGISAADHAAEVHHVANARPAMADMDA